MKRPVGVAGEREALHVAAEVEVDLCPETL